MVKRLRDRLTPDQLAKRHDKITTRSVSKEQVVAQVNQQDQYIWQAFQGFVQSNLWTRLRWVILGAKYVNRTGTIILSTAAGVIVLIVALIHLFALGVLHVR